MNHSSTFDVIVVGAGPSGLTTACALARVGVSVLVIEKHRGLSRFPKATGLRPRTMEIIRSWGLTETVLAQSQPTRLTMAIRPFLSVPGTEVSMGLPTTAELAAVSPSGIAVCPQDRFEAVLLDHLVEHGGVIHFDTELIGLTQDATGVTLVVRSTVTGQLSELTAAYVVGADGARSAVREGLGIGYDHLGSEGNHLATLFRADLSAVVPEEPHALTALVGPGVEGMLVPTGEDDRWIYDIEWHPENGETLEEWSVERMTARIRSAAGLPGLEPDLIGMFPWDFGAAVARQQHRDRVFLVGDAAHRTTPRGATGMNTGVADGHNLGWKLAWVVCGWADPTLLDSYAAERAPVGRNNAEASLRSAIGASAGDALAHDFGVVYRSGAVLGAGEKVGGRAPHVWVRSGGTRVSTLDLFDGRMTVITGPDGHRWRRAAAALAEAGIPLAVLSVDDELTDAEDLVEAYGLGESGCVLVRPDGYLAWVGTAAESGEDLERAVQQITGLRVAELVA